MRGSQRLSVKHLGDSDTQSMLILCGNQEEPGNMIIMRRSHRVIISLGAIRQRFMHVCVLRAFEQERFDLTRDKSLGPGDSWNMSRCLLRF